MPATPVTRRRWFQFGLGTMLTFVVVIAALALAVRERGQRDRLEAQMDRERHRFDAELKKAQIETKRAQRMEKMQEDRVKGLLQQLQK